jgi:hypothetical protein
MSKHTGMLRKEHKGRPEPWQSWPYTARYLLVQFAQAVPDLLLLWLAVVRH